MSKGTLITVVICLGLGIAYAATEMMPERMTAPTWSIPAVKDTATKVEIVREGETIVLEKENERWSMTQPVKFAASQSSIDKLLELFEKEIGVDLMIPVKEDELPRYELEPDKGISLTLWRGSEKVSSFLIGKGLGKRTFVKPAGEMVVYRAKSNMKWKVDKKAADWREKRILTVDRDDIVKLVLHHPAADGGPVTLERDKKAEGEGYEDTWQITGPVTEPADKSTVSSLLGSLVNLRAQGFADEVKVADAGFTDDAFKVTLHPAPGKGDPQTVVFGPEIGEDRMEGKNADDRFARRADADTVYIVRKYTHDNSRKPLAELRSKEIFSGLKRESIAGLTLESADGKVVFHKDGEDWKVAEPADLQGNFDASPLNSLLSSLASLRAAKVLDAMDDLSGGFTPAVRKGRVTIKLADGSEKILLVGGLADETKKEWYARLENTPAPVWVLRDYVVRQMTKGPAGFKKKGSA
jgi:hypothetical protein